MSSPTPAWASPVVSDLANIGDHVYKSPHGPAPRYAELNPPIVNIIAMILSAAKLVEHVGEADKADRIRNAVAAVVKEGRVRAHDLMCIPAGTWSIRQGEASTVQMTVISVQVLKNHRDYRCLRSATASP